jgi:hypothetical protein
MEGLSLNVEFSRAQEIQESFIAELGRNLEGAGLRKMGSDGYDEINHKHTTDVYGDVLSVVVSVGVNRGSDVPIRVSYAEEKFFDDAVKIRDEIVTLARKKYPEAVVDYR